MVTLNATFVMIATSNLAPKMRTQRYDLPPATVACLDFLTGSSLKWCRLTKSREAKFPEAPLSTRNLAVRPETRSSCRIGCSSKFLGGDGATEGANQGTGDVAADFLLAAAFVDG